MKINLSSSVFGLMALSMAFSLSTPCTAGKWTKELTENADWETLDNVIVQGIKKANETSLNAKKQLWLERMKDLYAAKPEKGSKLAQEKYTEFLLKALELKDQKAQSALTQKTTVVQENIPSHYSNALSIPDEKKKSVDTLLKQEDTTSKSSSVMINPKSEDLETWDNLNKTASGRIRLRQEALLLIENGPSLGTKPSQKHGGLFGGLENALGGDKIAIENLKKVIHLDPLPEEITWEQYGCARKWVKKYNLALLEKLNNTLNGPIKEKYTK
ncbi:hypothetical protein Bealeia1_00480 [Candidatus Bealeia paramacronuclearis]|uniref:Lipoprotein n=1 Tax=Candidatus Bealeia paramacronuclearis TaxID=1921001 RepID=A0ABZ2C1C3_9PROT|nr:hypothetical protein [Candidatus Bealeia paramacronuclearis]